jgi:hypothetical protein
MSGVLIQEAHASRTPWQKHERIEQRLRASVQALDYERRGELLREAPALLQGRAVCHLCGSRMHMHYLATGLHRG